MKWKLLSAVMLCLSLTACSSSSIVAGQTQTTTSTVAHSTTTQPVKISSSSASSTAITTQTAASATSATPTTGTAPSQMSAMVYFTIGTTLKPVSISVSPTHPLHDALEALLAGPRGAGLYTQIPPGTQLLSVAVSNGIATINLSSQVASIQGSPAIPLMLAQIVDTATQFSSVHRVHLLVSGKPLTTLGGEGVPVPNLLDRTTIQHMLAQAQ